MQALVQQISAIEVTVTNSETEALLLEYNLIKAHKPRFNIVLRDDKSFPYIQLCEEHRFPRLAFYRGPRSAPGRYFGPFPNAGAVRDTLNQLQRLFRIRNCRDSFFANRSRPCLQHQIGRCSAPCVGLIAREAYVQDLAAAVKVLEGRSEEVTAELQARMEEAAARLEFERAAQIRDQLAALQRVQSQQFITADGERDVDVFAIVGEAGDFAVSVMLVRGGRNLGTTSYFPRAALAEPHEALASFVMQYYAGTEVPPEVLLGSRIEEAEALAEVLSARAGQPVAGAPPGARACAALGGTDPRERHAGAAHALRPAPGDGRDAGGPCAGSSTCRRRRSGSSASTSATRAGRARSPPAWYSDPTGR